MPGVRPVGQIPQSSRKQQMPKGVKSRLKKWDCTGVLPDRVFHAPMAISDMTEFYPTCRPRVVHKHQTSGTKKIGPRMDRNRHWDCRIRTRRTPFILPSHACGRWGDEPQDQRACGGAQLGRRGRGLAAAAAVAAAAAAAAATATTTAFVGLDFRTSGQVPGIGTNETAVGVVAARPSREKPGRHSVGVVDPLFRCVQGHGVGAAAGGRAGRGPGMGRRV